MAMQRVGTRFPGLNDPEAGLAATEQHLYAMLDEARNNNWEMERRKVLSVPYRATPRSVPHVWRDEGSIGYWLPVTGKDGHTEFMIRPLNTEGLKFGSEEEPAFVEVYGKGIPYAVSYLLGKGAVGEFVGYLRPVEPPEITRQNSPHIWDSRVKMRSLGLLPHDAGAADGYGMGC